MKHKPKTKTFAEQLRDRRGERTYGTAAVTIGVSLRTYQNWEQGRSVPDPIKQQAVLERL